MNSLPDSAALLAPARVSRLSDEELLERSRCLAELRRLVDSAQAEVASEIAFRSSRDLGSEGLAQRLGQRTPEKLVQTLTGSTARDAKHLVNVGTLLTPTAPVWLGDVGAAVAEGRIGLDAAETIRAGLGTPTGDVAADDLADAAAALVARAPAMTPEKLAEEVRFARAELDAAGVADREAERRDRRFLNLIPQADGMLRIAGLADPESGARLKAVFDAATSPRSGGPRFVDPDRKTAAEAVVRDDRTTEELALDVFVQLVEIGADADPTMLVGGTPSITVHVAERDRIAGVGAAYLEGQAAEVSIDTVERLGCTGTTRAVLFDSAGDVLDLGTEQRLFTRRQRIALAARDGGCMMPGCERPPSWCEAHHTIPYSKGGKTDLADGILLCRHHHLLIHNNGWEIRRDAEQGFLLIPPRASIRARIPSRCRRRARRCGASSAPPERSLEPRRRSDRVNRACLNRARLNPHGPIAAARPASGP